ncbi:hypothetical protein SH139x_002291 [Planctomycetaceae bacterium SH139]
MKRAGRLIAARSWLSAYTGKNIVRGYCKHFAVDWRCAAIELQMLGVKIDPDYLACRERADQEVARLKEKRRRELAAEQLAREQAHWHSYTDSFTAYLAGDIEAAHDLWLREQAIAGEESAIFGDESGRMDICY